MFSCTLNERSFYDRSTVHIRYIFVFPVLKKVVFHNVILSVPRCRVSIHRILFLWLSVLRASGIRACYVTKLKATFKKMRLRA